MAWRWLSVARRKSRITFPMIVILIKAALAPTITLCLLLSDDIAAYYGFVGYLAAILAINPVLPQGQFLELMLGQTLAVCLASATTLLQLFCVIKARQHTEAPVLPPSLSHSDVAPPPVPYNSSASAVAAVWLVLQIFMVCFIRSAKPQLTMPCINYSVPVVVTSAVAPSLPNMGAATSFAKSLLVVNLSGLASSLAVVMILWPSTNRKAFKQGLAKWKSCIEICLQERTEKLADTLVVQQSKAEGNVIVSTSVDSKRYTVGADSVVALLETTSTLEQNLPYAKRELCDLQAHTYHVLQPILALLSGIDLLQRSISDENTQHDPLLFSKWDKEVTAGCEILIAALKYSITTLEISVSSRRTSAIKDIEAADVQGELSIERLRRRLREVSATVEAEVADIASSATSLEAEDSAELVRFSLLQVNDALQAACSNALGMAEYAGSKVLDGTMSKRRLILPNLPSLWKISESGTGSSASGGSAILAAKSSRKPNRLFGKLTAKIHEVLWILRSPHAGFAARISLAVLSAEILAFLESTQRWFNVHRGVWTAITIAIVTTRTVGQSIFGLLCQIAGTLAGALLSLLAWYIVNRHIPGVIVFYFIGMVVLGYPMQRSPMLLSLSLGSSVTLTLLVGYELETERIGEEAITANGVPYYPPYILSWLNLLAILAGVGIAAFWTLFPYPILESDDVLIETSRFIEKLAELYLRTHAAVSSRVRGHTFSNESDRRRAEELAALQKSMITELAGIAKLLDNNRYQIPLSGHHFPRDGYLELLRRIERTFRALSVTYYSTRAFDEIPTEQRDTAWLAELHRVASPNTDIEARTVSALLACAQAIARNQPLFLLFNGTETSALLSSIRESPMELLAASHLKERGYSALASIHASALTVDEEVRGLVELTSDLVGRLEIELDWEKCQ